MVRRENYVFELIWSQIIFWLIVMFVLSLVACANCNAQSYIGKYYDGVLYDMQTTFKSDVTRYEEDVASDRTKSLTVYFQTGQITSYAFDRENKCFLYIVVMPDTSGHAEFTEFLNKRYQRYKPEYWYERKLNQVIVWRFTKSESGRRSVIYVYPIKFEVEINKLIEEFANAK